ncbi:hypothetical protein ABVC62_08575 [Prevotella bivia]
MPAWVKLVWLFQQEHLRKIEENTGSSAASLKVIGDDIKKIIRDGVKVK